MSRLGGILGVLLIGGCSLGTDLGSSRYIGSDARHEPDTAIIDPSDASTDPPVDPRPDIDDARTDPPVDAPTDVVPDDVDVPDIPQECSGDGRDFCPPGPDNTDPVGCSDDGECLYGCLPGFVDLDDDGACECEIRPETCDGHDEDCNGVIDDDLDTVSCELQDGVCQGSVAGCGDGVADCDDQVYSGFAAGHGTTYDPLTPELLCDGHDNDCDGDVDPLCCDQGTPWVRIEPIESGLAQLHPSITRKGTVGAVAWVEASSRVFEGSIGPAGIVRYAYLDTLANVTEMWTLSMDERASQVDIVRSEKADRFVIARVVPGSLVGPEVRQWEVHHEPKRDALVYESTNMRAVIDGLDQTYVDRDTILVTWAVRTACDTPGCGVVYVRALDRGADEAVLGPTQQVSTDAVIAFSPRITSVGTRSLLAYRFDGPGINDARTRGLRWQRFDDERMEQGASGEFVFDPTLDTATRDWEVFAYGSDVAVVIPAPPRGAVSLLVISMSNPAQVRVIPLHNAGSTSVVTGFTSDRGSALSWWSEERRSLRLASFGDTGATERTPLINDLGQLGSAFGVAATSIGDWALLAATHGPDREPARLHLAAISHYGGRLCTLE